MNLKNVQIKETKAEDFNEIIEVEKLAFGYDKEARLVAELLTDKTAEPILSLLAFDNGNAVGHILFTRAYFDREGEQPMIHILAPLAVIPAYQNMGIGGMLIKEGLRILKERGTKLVFVLGHKEYYPRYGFIPKARVLGFPAPYSLPEEYDDYWMVQSLDTDGAEIIKGKIRCSDILNQPQHWRDDENDR